VKSNINIPKSRKNCNQQLKPWKEETRGEGIGNRG